MNPVRSPGWMSRPASPTDRTTQGKVWSEALTRRGALRIRFDPESSWHAAPAGWCGGDQAHSDAALQTCLSMKALSGMAPNQPPARADR